MKVIIDIDDDLYTRLFDNGQTDAFDMLKACSAIRKGTSLPDNATNIPISIFEQLISKCVEHDLRAYSDGVNDALDKIRDEIWDLQYDNEEKSMTDEDRADAYNNAIRQVIEIIDKHKAESEE